MYYRDGGRNVYLPEDLDFVIEPVIDPTNADKRYSVLFLDSTSIDLTDLLSSLPVTGWNVRHLYRTLPCPGSDDCHCDHAMVFFDPTDTEQGDLFNLFAAVYPTGVAYAIPMDLSFLGGIPPTSLN